MRLAVFALCVIQNATAAPHTMENRFLFIIDTSAAMKSRREGVDTAVTELLQSNMKGEMRNGDTFGVWTYSEKLNTEFPRQVWAGENNGQITGALLQYLHLVPAEKRSRLEKVWPGLQQAVLNSERLTVILIHDGSDPIKGTPFDSDINELQRQYARQFKSSHDPFVTVLSASNHVFFDYSINFPSAITLPHTEDPLQPPVTNTPAPVVATAPPPLKHCRPRLRPGKQPFQFPRLRLSLSRFRPRRQRPLSRTSHRPPFHLIRLRPHHCRNGKKTQRRLPQALQ